MEPAALTDDLIAPTARALARAFRDNAGFVCGLRGCDAAAREAKLVRIMRSFAIACRRWGDATIVAHGDDVAGAALAYPPGAFPLPFRGWLRNGLGALTVGPRHTIRLARMEHYMGKRHLRGPHWYLFVLGVDPAHQGAGHGGALLRRLGAHADAAGADSWLETDEERNVGLYRKFGYEIVDEAMTPWGFRMWHMRRGPRASGLGPRDEITDPSSS